MIPPFRFAKGWGSDVPRVRRGLWVVLLGPDGAGKSSVIAAAGSGRSAGFTGCEAHHLRPVFFASPRTPTANCDPHGQSARGTVISLMKLVYLLVAIWLGYLLVVRRQLKLGKLILFDRYFPDCLADPKRYRLPQSCHGMVKLVARLVPQPDWYVVLDVPAHVLQERKREVSAAESEQQRREYARLAAKLPNVATVDATRPLPDVVDEIRSLIIEWHLARYQARSYKAA